MRTHIYGFVPVQLQLKNHYYLLQMGHMLSQCMEAWGRIESKFKFKRQRCVVISSDA